MSVFNLFVYFNDSFKYHSARFHWCKANINSLFNDHNKKKAEIHSLDDDACMRPINF